MEPGAGCRAAHRLLLPARITSRRPPGSGEGAVGERIVGRAAGPFGVFIVYIVSVSGGASGGASGPLQQRLARTSRPSADDGKVAHLGAPGRLTLLAADVAAREQQRQRVANALRREVPSE